MLLPPTEQDELKISFSIWLAVDGAAPHRRDGMHKWFASIQSWAFSTGRVRAKLPAPLHAGLWSKEASIDNELHS